MSRVRSTWARLGLMAAMLALFAAGAMALTELPGERAAAQPEVATPIEVVRAPAPVAWVGQVKNGLQVEWWFDEATMTPHGWELASFSINRWFTDEQRRTTFLKAKTPKARRLVDKLNGANRDQLSPGYRYSYEVYAVYHRLSDGAEQVGKRSDAVIFTLPEMPRPVDMKIQSQYVDGETVWQATWYPPHLTWLTSSSASGVSLYIIELDQTRVYSGSTYGPGDALVDRRKPNGQREHFFDHKPEPRGARLTYKYGKFYSSVFFFPAP